MTLVLSQGQQPKQKPTQQAKQSLSQEITLKQYLAHEDFIKGLITYVHENNKLKSFNKS